MTKKPYREWDPRQRVHLPPSPMEWLPEDDFVYFILEILPELDISKIEDKIQSKQKRGTRPYDPRMMVALLLYGYCTGTISSRKIEKATYRDLAYRVLVGNHHPDHTVISEFRRQHMDALRGLFLQTVKLCQRAGMVRLGCIALDGTKVKASASKHKAMSYERMLKSELELEAEIKELLEQAEAADQDEANTPEVGGWDERLPEELRLRRKRLKKIRQAKRQLEEEAAAARAAKLQELADANRAKAQVEDDPAEKKRAQTRAEKQEKQAQELGGGEDDDQPPKTGGHSSDEDLPKHRVATTPEGNPKPKSQMNFTDADSRIMVRDGAFIQAYNCQAAVDDAYQVIVSCAATNQAPDQQHLPGLVDGVKHNCGEYPDAVITDTGYWAEKHVEFCEDRCVTPYIAVKRKKHRDQASLPRGRIPNDLSARERMARKLKTKSGKAVYSRRKVIVEPVFGQIRECNGFTAFLLRGLRKVRAEWALVCACHNLLKLWRRSLQTA